MMAQNEQQQAQPVPVQKSKNPDTRNGFNQKPDFPQVLSALLVLEFELSNIFIVAPCLGPAACQTVYLVSISVSFLWLAYKTSLLTLSRPTDRLVKESHRLRREG